MICGKDGFGDGIERTSWIVRLVEQLQKKQKLKNVCKYLHKLTVSLA